MGACKSPHHHDERIHGLGKSQLSGLAILLALFTGVTLQKTVSRYSSATAGCNKKKICRVFRFACIEKEKSKPVSPQRLSR